MEENKFDIIKDIQEIIGSEKLEDADKFLNELYIIFSKFSLMSNRVLRVLKKYMPYGTAKIGLSMYLSDLIEKRGPISYKEIKETVNEEFEYTVTSKAITDSLSYLTKGKEFPDIVRYFDASKPGYRYKKRE